jgi:hypothetical protein
MADDHLAESLDSVARAIADFFEVRVEHGVFGIVREGAHRMAAERRTDLPDRADAVSSLSRLLSEAAQKSGRTVDEGAVQEAATRGRFWPFW